MILDIPTFNYHYLWDNKNGHITLARRCQTCGHVGLLQLGIGLHVSKNNEMKSTKHKQWCLLKFKEHSHLLECYMNLFFLFHLFILLLLRMESNPNCGVPSEQTSMFCPVMRLYSFLFIYSPATYKE